MSHPSRLTASLLAGTGAGLVWGLAFLVPALLPGWSAVAVTAGRYLAYGMLSLALLAWEGRAAWRLAREHWRAALAFAVTGNVGYYLLLVIGIQKIGAPVTDTIIGSIPVVVAVASNWRTPALPWRLLAAPVALSLAGLALTNAAEFAGAHSTVAAPPGVRLFGLAAAVGAVAVWTWYGLANAAFLATRPAIPPGSWSSVVGLATLAVTLAALPLVTLLGQTTWPAASRRDTVMFLAGIAVLGVAVSWGGTWLWNSASARLPATTAGMLINVETVSGYVYVYAARQHWPPPGQMLGFALILAGVGLALTRRQAPGTPPPPGRRAAPGLAMPAEEAPVSDDRHQQDQKTKPDLHTAGEPRRIDHLDQVVRDESAAVSGLPGLPAQVVLQQRERAGEARELHQSAVYDGGDVRPDDPGPSPREKHATHHEADE